ncbi:fatty acid-binding protein, muscle-like [Schistocerca cancellata]|uniref:fatty acid-binding protein, muscle-like n=1 Tax=Schistocerca cancellata TaxID=274614 RepID=UPI0021197DDD|nr:fatty acid-binding protein, muscle-like [Schistocerca cancellata]
MYLEEFLGRRYKLVKSENFNEYMKAIGICCLMRMVANNVRPAMILTRAGHWFTITSLTGVFTTTTRFRLNDERYASTHDGRRVARVFTLEGSTLTCVERGHKLVTTVFDFTAEELKMTITVDDVVCTRIFEAIRGMELEGFMSAPHQVPHVGKK